MTEVPKDRDGESTPEELIEIHRGVADTPTKEEAEELTNEFGDDEGRVGSL